MEVNDRCPCGSGKKVKRCCATRIDMSQTRRTSFHPETVEMDGVEHPVTAKKDVGPSLSLMAFMSMLMPGL